MEGGSAFIPRLLRVSNDTSTVRTVQVESTQANCHPAERIKRMAENENYADGLRRESQEWRRMRTMQMDCCE